MVSKARWGWQLHSPTDFSPRSWLQALSLRCPSTRLRDTPLVCLPMSSCQIFYTRERLEEHTSRKLQQSQMNAKLFLPALKKRKKKANLALLVSHPQHPPPLSVVPTTRTSPLPGFARGCGGCPMCVGSNLYQSFPPQGRPRFLGSLRGAVDAQCVLGRNLLLVVPTTRTSPLPGFAQGCGGRPMCVGSSSVV